LLRDLQEFAEVSDRFHTGSSRDWRRPGFPGGLFSNSSGRLRLALAGVVKRRQASVSSFQQEDGSWS
jgi:hypothetical protein